MTARTTPERWWYHSDTRSVRTEARPVPASAGGAWRTVAEGVCGSDGELIAAAPELRAFVERALDSCFCDDGRGLPECARCAEARALIARLDGDA